MMSLTRFFVPLKAAQSTQNALDQLQINSDLQLFQWFESPEQLETIAREIFANHANWVGFEATFDFDPTYMLNKLSASILAALFTSFRDVVEKTHPTGIEVDPESGLDTNIHEMVMWAAWDTYNRNTKLLRIIAADKITKMVEMRLAETDGRLKDMGPTWASIVREASAGATSYSAFHVNIEDILEPKTVAHVPVRNMKCYLRVFTIFSLLALVVLTAIKIN